MLCVFCLHICLCIMYMPSAEGGQKTASDLLKLELQQVVSHHVSARY